MPTHRSSTQRSTPLHACLVPVAADERSLRGCRAAPSTCTRAAPAASGTAASPLPPRALLPPDLLLPLPCAADWALLAVATACRSATEESDAASGRWCTGMTPSPDAMGGTVIPAAGSPSPPAINSGPPRAVAMYSGGRESGPDAAARTARASGDGSKNEMRVGFGDGAEPRTCRKDQREEGAEA
jgi:hypothetical protein